MRNEKKETPLLRDGDVFPSEKVLRKALGTVYPVFRQFADTATSEKYGLTFHWNYYRDGKAWLCKAVYKKKTVAWISFWDGWFRVSFYFTERSGSGISQLDIDSKLKEQFASGKTAGKLIPVVVKVADERQLDDVYALIEYKKSAK
jgi:hypothetical protein